jgi:hypothetical protein
VGEKPQNETDGGARWAPIQMHFRGKWRVDTGFSGRLLHTPLLETPTSRPPQNVSVPRRLRLKDGSPEAHARGEIGLVSLCRK